MPRVKKNVKLLRLIPLTELRLRIPLPYPAFLATDERSARR